MPLLFPFSFIPQIEKQSETLIEASFIGVFLFSCSNFTFFCSLLETHLLEFEIIVEKLVNLFAIEGSPMPRIVVNYWVCFILAYDYFL